MNRQKIVGFWPFSLPLLQQNDSNHGADISIKHLRHNESENCHDKEAHPPEPRKQKILEISEFLA